MEPKSLESYLAGPLAPGPIAVMLCDDGRLAAETARWLAERGFAATLALGPAAAAAGDDAIQIAARALDDEGRAHALNRLIAAHAGDWMLVCRPGEFLFFPYCRDRSVRDLTDFLETERRSSATAYAIDLYGREPDPDFPLEEAFFDAAGWYAFDHGGGAVEVYGGLGWRFEEHLPARELRVNRPALFRAAPLARIKPDLWFEEPEMNAVACPWHHNPTLALMSVRRTRRLLSSQGFAASGRSLLWPRSTRFEWRSEQLSALGFIEPGQWV